VGQKNPVKRGCSNPKIVSGQSALITAILGITNPALLQTPDNLMKANWNPLARTPPSSHDNPSTTELGIVLVKSTTVLIHIQLRVTPPYTTPC
jgi:hypothetical protein